MEIYLNNFINTLTFFSIIIFFQYSIIGYQKIFFKKNNNNELIDFIATIIILNFFGYITYLFSIPTNYLSIFLWLIGFLFFIKQKNFQKIFKEIFIISMLFLGLLISKTHEDFIPWHFPYLLNIYNENLILGIGNKEINFVYAPFFAYFQVLFFNPILEYKFVNVGIFLIFVNFILFHLKRFFKFQNLLSAFLIIFIIIKHSRFSEYGYDFLPLLILISIFFYYIENQNQKKKNLNINIIFLLFVYAVSIRSISLFFLPLFIFMIFKNRNFKLKFDIYFYLLILLTIFYLSNNFIKSGCILFFIEESCVSKNIFQWAVSSEQINLFSNHVELWAKSFYAQKDILEKEIYLSNFVWIKFWFKKHFFYKVSEYLLLLSFILLLFYLFSEKKKHYFKNKSIIFFTILNILFWFFFLPQLRFGSVNLIILFLTFISFLKINKKIKYIKILLILSFIIFNLKNVIRINDELKRNDKYKYTNFPYISVHQDLVKKFNYNKKLFNIVDQTN